MRKTILLLTAMALMVVGYAGAASAATTFSNENDITFNDGGCTNGEASTAPDSASPYPSQISVSGLGSSVSDVNVTISGLTHTFPDDIGLLLVSPAGQSTILMTDSGGDTDANGVNLTFDDAASGPVPDNDDPALSSGIYQPTRGTTPANYGCGAPASFPAPAPASPYGTSLSVFNGTNPNGTWKLYVIDDSQVDTGSISSWSLDISAAGATYDFTGFFSPVDNPEVATNKAKAGSSIPVKFSLGGDQGLDIFEDGYPRSQQIPNPQVTVDGIEQTVTAGSSGLSYDPTTGFYTYVWKTEKAWAGQYRQLVVQFDDGTVKRANFIFTK